MSMHQLDSKTSDSQPLAALPLVVIQHRHTKEISLLQDDHDTALNDLKNVSIIAKLPPLNPENLAGSAFTNTHKARYPYIVGEMAHGIATAKMVIAAAKAGFFSCFGAAGLAPSVVEDNLHVIRKELGDKVECWGSNLIHSPHDPELEETLVDLYLRLNVRRVSASAYLSLSPQIVRYAVSGLRTDAAGRVVRKNFILAKLSRPEVAKHFMSPPSHDILRALVAKNQITINEAELAATIPVAEDITVEADSGGHTDNRPLGPLFSIIHQQASMMQSKYGYQEPFRLGAAGGLGTPHAVASAFMLGASYVLTGSINAASIESGLSVTAKEMLSKASISDVIMAPAADMFELGVKLQVLKRGSLFALRANKLYELYRNYSSIENIPPVEKEKIEREIFKNTLEKIWELTQTFFKERSPEQIKRAEKDEKYRMALVFRWYLGLSSSWAMQGDRSRQIDYQLWCGPAMGAFNAWVEGTFLEKLENRGVVEIGLNLLHGAAAVIRTNELHRLGLNLPPQLTDFEPRPFTS